MPALATDGGTPFMKTLGLTMVVIVGAAAIMTLVLLIGSTGSARRGRGLDNGGAIDPGLDATEVARRFWATNGTPDQHAYAVGDGDMAAMIARNLDPLGRAMRVTMLRTDGSGSTMTMSFDVCTQPAGGPTKRLMADTTVSTIDGVSRVTRVAFTVEPVFADCDTPAPALGVHAFTTATPTPRATESPVATRSSVATPSPAASTITSGGAYLDCLLGPSEEEQTVDRAVADCRAVQPPDWSDSRGCRVFEYTKLRNEGSTAADAEARTEAECARFAVAH